MTQWESGRQPGEDQSGQQEPFPQQQQGPPPPGVWHPPAQAPYPPDQYPPGRYPQGQYPPPPAGSYPPAGYPPPSGYAPPGTYPPGSYPPPAPPPRSNTTRNLIIVILAVLVVAGGVAGIVAATSGGKKHDGPPSKGDAQAVVDRYLADINKGDKSDAAALICSRFRDVWRRNLQSPRNDFDFKIADKRVTDVGTGTLPNSTKLTYVLQIEYQGQQEQSTVPFTVINEQGAKICGES